MTVKQIQHLLAYLGYYTMAVDGISGPGTVSAVTAFQGDFGLEADGIPGTATQKALKHAVAYGMPEKAGANDGQEDQNTGTFWDEIGNFSREEFRCGCKGVYCNGFPAEPAEALVRAAQQVRDHFGAPVTVSSGVRCPRHNTAVKGVPTSRHLRGRAMDFSVRGQSAAAVLAYVKTLAGVNYAYSMGGGWVHVDV